MKKMLRALVPLLVRKEQIVKFPWRVLRTRLALKPIDGGAPFLGPLSSSGVYSSSISSDALRELEQLYSERELNSRFEIRLKMHQKAALAEIFGLLEPIVRAYLGKESYLDGINWGVSQPNEKSISGHWHTDNVGNRLKCFVCVKGDGKTPTLIILSNDRYPSFTTVIYNTAIELLRRVGLKAEFKLRNQFSANHKKGSLFIFDTQLLHRGGYNQGQTERIIFHLEFSDRRKHRLVNGSVGTFTHNSFCFDNELEDLKSFSSLLDKERLVQLDDGSYAYHSDTPPI